MTEFDNRQQTPLWPRPLYQHLLYTQMHIKGMNVTELDLQKLKPADNALPDMDHPQWHGFMKGVRDYQAAAKTYRRGAIDYVWRQSETSLAFYPHQGAATGRVILFIPSLINKSYILDLYETRSMVRWLAAQGHDVYLLDWGTPHGESLHFSIEDYISKRLYPAMDFIKSRHAAKTSKIDVAGFCMGGLFALAAAILRPDDVRGLSLLAMPWDFHAPDTGNAMRFATLYETLKLVFDCRHHIPVDMVQTLFLSLDPFVAYGKFMKFIQMNAAEQAHFIALEDWANDGVPLSLPVANQAVHDWYRDNKTHRGTWRIGDVVINPASVQCPVFIATPRKDRLVPYESSVAVTVKMRTEQLITHVKPDAGHTAMIVSSKAENALWRPMNTWLKA